MVKISNSKEPSLKESIDTSGENFKYFKFNFSFITSNRKFCFNNPKFDNKHKAQLLKRIFELSSMPSISVRGSGKAIGIELIDEKQFKKTINCDEKFYDEDYRKKGVSSKYTVFRLYTNNNPIPARIVGKTVGNVFYVFGIDLNHESYKG